MNFLEMQIQNIEQSVNLFLTTLIDMKKLLENSDREVRMWRERYLKEVSISDDEVEASYLSNIVLFTPVGIENIDDYLEKCLKSYRETKK